MRRIETLEDQMRGTITYDLGDNQFIRLDARTVREFGIEEILRQAGHGDKIPTGRLFSKHTSSWPLLFYVGVCRRI